MPLHDTPVLVWNDLEQHYGQLEMRAVNSENIYDFLLDWSETQISRVVHLMTWVGFMDSIQHWIYAEASDDVTIEELDKAAELINRFMPQTDWTMFPRELRKRWQYHHIFTAPFYYVEYALSWLGALQLWQQSLNDRKKVLSNYRSSLELGNSRSVPELFHAAGTKFAFDRSTIRAMVEFLRSQIDKFCAKRQG